MPNLVSVCRLVLVEVLLYVLANDKPKLEDSELQLVECGKKKKEISFQQSRTWFLSPKHCHNQHIYHPYKSMEEALKRLVIKSYASNPST